jgi:pyruvate,water dikinase
VSASTRIGWFADIGLADRARVGGKGGSLGELTRAGIAVPPGFVVTTAAFEEFAAALDTRAAVATLAPGDLPSIESCAKRLRARVESAEFPPALRAEIGAAYRRLAAAAGGAVAVRSSATTEDASDASFAGLQDTYLWITDEPRMLDRVRACWASLYSMESISYRRDRGIDENVVSMAVVVQSMVEARTAGVMFTRSPTTGDRSVITIEGAWGLGSAVVGGEVTPDRWVLSKITGEISVREISDKHIEHRRACAGGVESLEVAPARRTLPCLADDELERLRVTARQIEKHYGRAQDIEWAIDANGALWLLQSRPETVWSAKEAAPVATAAADPLAHVMAVFGGRR